MKKLVPFLLVLMMAVLFAGCGNEEKKDIVPSNTPEISGSETNVPENTNTPTPTIEPTATTKPTATPKPTATSTPTPLSMPDKILKEVFAEHGMKVGTCIGTNMTNNTKYAEFIKNQFNSVTMENSMKPEAILSQAKSKEAGEIVVSFGSDAIKLFKWAKENDMAMRGHTLVWHSQTPEWIFHEGFDNKNDLVDRDTMLARLDSYMKQVFEWLTENEYIDMIYAYDIANECWMENGSMRDSFWLKTIGEDYLYQTFKIARKYAPETVDLYYNDYNEQYKTDTFVKFIESMKDEDGNYLLDGIGFQAHLYTKDDMKTYFKTLDTISALGLKVQLTELDVCLGKYQGYLKATTENLLVQGKYMYDLIAGIFERVDNGTLNSDALTFWGFKDDLSWRKDGSPLLMDKNMNPKPAFFGALQMKEEVGY